MLRIVALVFVGMLAITGCDEPETADPEEPGIEEPDDLVFEEEEEPEMDEAADEGAEEAAEEDEEADDEEGDDEEEPEEEEEE